MVQQAQQEQEALTVQQAQPAEIPLMVLQALPVQAFPMEAELPAGEIMQRVQAATTTTAATDPAITAGQAAQAGGPTAEEG